ncbi:MAG: hypothetical protein IJ946_08195 [Clostridia bacterium]|nr:hypothetical protein [Clostridia bacterium]
MNYDIIIQAGQSNAEGYGFGPVEKEYEVNDKILHMNALKSVVSHEPYITITYEDKPFEIIPADYRENENGKIGDFSLSFSSRFVEEGMLDEDRKLLIIRAGVGSTGFVRGNWGKCAQLGLKMLEMIDYALSLGEDCRLVAFLWHQGETDAARGCIPEVYRMQIENMVNLVRSRYNAYDLPFIAGDFVHHWKNMNLKICEPIISKLNEALDNLGNSAFVKTDGLLSNNQKIGNKDVIHFCRQSLHELGERYFEAYKDIIKA